MTRCEFDTGFSGYWTFFGLSLECNLQHIFLSFFLRCLFCFFSYVVFRLKLYGLHAATLPALLQLKTKGETKNPFFLRTAGKRREYQIDTNVKLNDAGARGRALAMRRSARPPLPPS